MQQPLQEQSDAKCQRTKIQMQFREPTCKKCTMQSSESWLKCIKSVILYPDSLLLPPSPKLHFFKAEISFSSTAGLHHLMQCSAVLCRLFFSLPTTWNCVYSQPFQDILSFYISPLAPDGIKLQVWLKAAFVYPHHHQSCPRGEQRHQLEALQTWEFCTGICPIPFLLPCYFSKSMQ